MSRRGEWVRSVPDGPTITWAKQIREERDKKRGNGYWQAETDERWIGELGPIMVSRWLHLVGCPDSAWLRASRINPPDFIIAAERISVRTVGRVRMREGYGASVLPRHVSRVVDRFVFCCFEQVGGVLWILGTLPKGEFLAIAERYRTGELVHPGLVPRTDTFEVPVAELTPVQTWISGVPGVVDPASVVPAQMVLL